MILKSKRVRYCGNVRITATAVSVSAADRHNYRYDVSGYISLDSRIKARFSVVRNAPRYSDRDKIIESVLLDIARQESKNDYFALNGCFYKNSPILRTEKGYKCLSLKKYQS